MQKKFGKHASFPRGGRGIGRADRCKIPKVSVHKRRKFILNARTRATNTINKLKIALRILLERFNFFLFLQT